jgi:hypothetical protein
MLLGILPLKFVLSSGWAPTSPFKLHWSEQCGEILNDRLHYHGN